MEVMKRAASTILILTAIHVLAGCNQQAMLEKFTSPAEQATAKAFIDQLRHHDFDPIKKAMDASLAGTSLDDTLDRMAALMPPDPPVSVTLIGAQRFSSTAAGTTVNLTYEYRFADRYVITNVETKLKDAQLSIVGFNVYPETESIESRNAFKWSGRSALHYAVLAYALCAALLTLVVLVVAARAKVARRKWMWIIFILFGVGKFSVNWTTGQWGIQIFALQLFSASSYADVFGPWIISVSLPLGAIVFLLCRNSMRIHDEKAAFGASAPTLNDTQ
jgi:uncharacterized lipoprotein YehR (DUF1307 family)